jgi:RimJ/RimL family protein N-acetyltransferase
MNRIASERLELISMSPGFMDAVLEGRRGEAESLSGMALPDGWPDAHDRRFLAFRLRQLREQPELEPWFVYGVALPDDPHPMVGHAGFHGPPGVNAVKADDAVEVGYAIFEPYRRRGYGTEVVRALIEWASREHEIARFIASISPDNVPSLALVRRLGFREVGAHWDEEDGEELEFEFLTSAGA